MWIWTNRPKKNVHNLWWFSTFGRIDRENCLVFVKMVCLTIDLCANKCWSKIHSLVWQFWLRDKESVRNLWGRRLSKSWRHWWGMSIPPVESKDNSFFSKGTSFFNVWCFFCRVIELHWIRRKTPTKTILLMVRKILHVAKTQIRKQNAQLSCWPQNFVAQNSYGK